jgi:Vacuolar 14 Fab1-binding region
MDDLDTYMVESTTKANSLYSIQEKPSLDEDIRSMLSVTPVNVPSSEQDQDTAARTGTGTGTGSSSVEEPTLTDPDAGVSNEDSFSSSSATSGSHDDSEETEDSDDSRREAEEADDDDDDDNCIDDDEDDDDDGEVEVEVEDDRETANDHFPAHETTHLSAMTSTPQSEWDRALMTGKESKGRAASDFFVPSQPILSSDSSEFYSTVQAARATAPGLRSPNHYSNSKNNTNNSIVQPQGGFTTINSGTTGDSRDRSTTDANSNNTGTKRLVSESTGSSAGTSSRPQDYYPTTAPTTEDNLSTGRQRIESINMFDSDLLRFTNDYVVNDEDDPMFQESRDSLKRSSQQSISAAVLVSLAHKRYERRRLAAMEIEKIVRSLVVLQHQQQLPPSKSSKSSNHHQNELDRVRAILLLLSDDYVRSTNEDARKGGVVALAACAIGLKKANDHNPIVQECRDLILASVVHACQDHSQRVRYYATESLFNVVKGTMGHWFVD